MKHIFLVIIAAFFALAGCKHKTKTEEADKYHKKRPESPLLKSVKTYASEADSINVHPMEQLLQLDEYDAKGNKIKVTRYLDSGRVEYVTDYEYDGKGNIIKSHTVIPSDHSESTEKNTYDDDKHITKTEWNRSDGTYGVHEYKFDKNGKLTEWDAYEKGHLTSVRLYPMVYDKNDHVVESFVKEVHGKDTVLQGHEKYSYDEATGLEAEKFVLLNNAILEGVETIYDSSRNKIMEKHATRDSMGNPVTQTVANLYDEFGEIIQATIYNNNTVVSTTNNTYDQYGHLTESVTVEGNTTKKVRYVYEFAK